MSKNLNNDPDQELPNHEYDGIRELNHPAPFWWQALFYLTIVFAAGYSAYYFVGDGRTLLQEYQAAWSETQVLQASLVKSQGPDVAQLTSLLKDPAALAQGQKAYAQRCVSCHAADGGGGIGPNLTDTAWINGNGQVDSIYALIQNGVAEKGMPPWGPIVSPEELRALTVYVRSMRGTQPADPKAAQGTVQTN
jgi:cytochrome c oxidase cbb3-type subunit 3